MRYVRISAFWPDFFFNCNEIIKFKKQDLVLLSITVDQRWKGGLPFSQEIKEAWVPPPGLLTKWKEHPWYWITESEASLKLYMSDSFTADVYTIHSPGHNKDAVKGVHWLH